MGSLFKVAESFEISRADWTRPVYFIVGLIYPHFLFLNIVESLDIMVDPSAKFGFNRVFNGVLLN